MIYRNPGKEFFPISLLLLINFLSVSSFLSGQTSPYDLVINEIMADPLPSVSLPESEYVELFNRSANPISLRNWSLYAGNHRIILPDSIIQPGGYMILSDEKYSGPGTITVRMPHITNTGQLMILKSPGGEVIHAVEFSDDWYRDGKKNNGGWSLEMIDPENPCGGKRNWKVADDPKGGTPGKKNSVFRSNPDREPPVLVNASLVSDTCVLLHFNEPLYHRYLESCGLYSIDCGIYHPASVYPFAPDYSDILLIYNTKFSKDVIYTVSILDDISDCAGNHPFQSLSVPFAFAEKAEESDIIINEILFDSHVNTEFVEIYNRSKKVIDLNSLVLSIANESGNIYNSAMLSDCPYSLLPGQFMVITKSSDDLTEFYKNIDLRTVRERPDMFALPDEKGWLILADTAGKIVDECRYNKHMQHDLFQSVSNVSLERINPDESSLTVANWQSASSTSGFATPGRQNSQLKNNSNDELIKIIPDIISPDADGIDDEVIFQICAGEPGRSGTIAIYNTGGRKVKTLAGNSLFGTNEIIKWDGKDDAGNIVPIGIYIVYGELFDTEGNVKKFKKVLYVVRK